MGITSASLGTPMNSQMSQGARQVMDAFTFIFAAVAVGSFWHGVALALTILSAIMGLVIGGFRVHDRIKYGPAPRR